MTSSDQGTVLRFGQFTNVDAGASDDLLAELDRRDRATFAVELRNHLYALLHPRAGEVVADIGCGTGKVVAELLEREVKAIGIDASEQAILRARARFPEADFRVASADALPFKDGEVHGYVAVLLYQHLPDPAGSLAEARRVLAPAGRLVVVDVEPELYAIDSDDQSIVRRLLPAFSDSLANPWIGRHLRRLLLEADFVDVAVELQPIVWTEFAGPAPVLRAMAASATSVGAVTSEQANSWLAEQERRSAEGSFFAMLPVYFASARRP